MAAKTIAVTKKPSRTLVVAVKRPARRRINVIYLKSEEFLGTVDGEVYAIYPNWLFADPYRGEQVHGREAVPARKRGGDE